MGRIIFSIVSLIALAVIIVMNVGSETSFNLLGWQFEAVPVTVIAIVSFVVGALYSFIFYFSSYIARTRKAKLDSRKQKLKSQEESMKERTQHASAADGTGPQARPADAAAAAPASSGPVRRLLGRKSK